MFKRKLSGLIIGVGFMFGVAGTANAGGIPTIDVANITQTTVSALKNVEAVSKQIQQYQTQLDQYKDQLLQAKTIAQAQQIWQQANSTINSMQAAANSLKTMKQQLGSMDKILELYKNPAEYSQNNCFSKAGCTATELARISQNRDAVLKLSQMYDQDVIKTVESQIDSLQKDAQELERLQKSAGNAEGQMQALTAANQIAAQTSGQLLQLRQLLTTEVKAQAAFRQAQIDKESKEKAASDKAWGQGKWKNI